MTNEEKQGIMRDRAAALLQEGAVSYIIGWRGTRFPDKTAIFFARDAADAGKLVWNAHTIPLTAKYLLDDRWPDKKIGIFARGCDSKAINRLLRDNQIERKNLHILGLPCEGKQDPRCLSCRQKDPLIHDELLWPPEAETSAAEASTSGVAKPNAAIASAAAPEPERGRFFRAE